MGSWAKGLAALAGAAGVVFAGVYGTSGCTSSNDTTASTPDAEAVCPNTVSAAAGAKCAYAGLECWIGYTCGALPAQAHCSCNGGLTFDCTDATHESDGTPHVVDPGSEPACSSNPAGEKCPESEVKAAGAKCKTVGLQCPYSNACPPVNGVSSFDTCTCEANPGGSGLIYVCQSPCVIQDAAADASDGGPIPVDGSDDASDASAGDASDAAAD